MKDNPLHIKRTLVYESELSELDFELYDEFGFDSDTHTYGIIDSKDDNCLGLYPINIDKLIKELTFAKENGATHVEVGYHTDHIGYIFEGYKIEAMSDTDIKEYNQRMKVEHRKREMIEDLYRQIREIEES